MTTRQVSSMRRRDSPSASATSEPALDAQGFARRSSPAPSAAGDLKGRHDVSKQRAFDNSKEEGMEMEGEDASLLPKDVVVDDTEVEKGCCDIFFDNIKRLFASSEPRMTQDETNKLVDELKQKIAVLDLEAAAAALEHRGKVHQLQRLVELGSQKVQAMEAAAKKNIGDLQEEVGVLKAKAEDDTRRHQEAEAGLETRLREISERLQKSNKDSEEIIRQLRAELRAKDLELKKGEQLLEARGKQLVERNQLLQEKDRQLEQGKQLLEQLRASIKKLQQQCFSSAKTIGKGQDEMDKLKANNDADAKRFEYIFELLTDWEVTGCLGKGGQGKVYRLERKTDTGAIETAVLKVFVRALEATREFVMLSESCLEGFVPRASRCIDMEDVCVDSDDIFEGGLVLMELVKGKTFKQLAEEAWFFSAANVDLVLIQALQWFKVMHNNRLCHSDVKPDNFMWENGRLKAIDLGMGRSEAVLTLQNGEDFLNAGSMAYMAPEVIVGNVQDQLCMLRDVFAFALMVVTGRSKYHYRPCFEERLDQWEPFVFDGEPAPSAPADLVSAYVEEKEYIASEYLDKGVREGTLSVWAKDVLVAMLSEDLEERATVLTMEGVLESAQLEGGEQAHYLMSEGGGAHDSSEEDSEEEEEDSEEDDD